MMAGSYLQLAQVFAKEWKKSPLNALRALLPACDDCGGATVAACSRCNKTVCITHGYMCWGMRDALCINCVEELRKIAAKQKKKKR